VGPSLAIYSPTVTDGAGRASCTSLRADRDRRVGHADGGALILKRYRHLYPSESYAAAPSLDALVAEG
jgi:hypothetical protein